MPKYLIIGGVAGGATVAARLRRLDEQSEIIIFERGKYISYANCGLPYYIGGTISERDNLFVQTPEAFHTRVKVDVRTEHEVIRINPQEKTVLVRNINSKKLYVESYDKLVLSPGAEPVRPPIPGIEDEGIFTMRNVPDTDAIKAYIDQHKIRRVVIVGAGFIGLEMAENLHKLGIFVTIVEMAEQVMTPLDFEMAAQVHQHLKTKKVEFYLHDAVQSFERSIKYLTVTLQSGKMLLCDMVILSIGVRPDSKLAAEANLELGVSKGIVVNEYMQTSDPDIYAIGDAICFASPITGKQMTAYLAGPANKQGRICADNLVFGNKRTYFGSVGTAIAKVFDLTVASTGVSEKTLKAENIPYLASITHSASHAGYYPHAQPMSIKIVFSPTTGMLLGAQIVGSEGVDKRIDLFSSVIRRKATIFDLEQIEHAYAPPFSSAKDPVNIAGFVAENIMAGLMNSLHWYELAALNPQEYLLVDVRTPMEFRFGSISGAINIPVDAVRERLAEFPTDKKIVLICGVGQRSYVAHRILVQNGFSDVWVLNGGYITYSHATSQQSNEDIFEHDYIGKDDHIYQGKPVGQ
jgi:NADPH-dependent 2,4-dienoyl-CoA reductase/sulfur reductase-like enzyme/rhodanese-related sulfurtransferase